MQGLSASTLSSRGSRHPACRAVVHLETRLYSLVDVSQNLIPPHQRYVAFDSQLFHPPCKQLCRHGTDWLPIRKTEE
jgi:hypothetical protein